MKAGSAIVSFLNKSWQSNTIIAHIAIKSFDLTFHNSTETQSLFLPFSKNCYEIPQDGP